ncbi:hypothetical protein BH11PSE7_BH11PSE7_02860 [soil metagenome]
MGIAMLTVSSLFAPLQGLISWFMPAAPQLHGQVSKPAFRPKCLQSVHTGNDVPRPVRSCAQRPLWVLRVVEANHAPASAGRMVISGRMADVCAELDRLAALEATRH